MRGQQRMRGCSQSRVCRPRRRSTGDCGDCEGECGCGLRGVHCGTRVDGTGHWLPSMLLLDTTL
eukprot:2156619-Pleurochrysis_carterae.AAC.2